MKIEALTPPCFFFVHQSPPPVHKPLRAADITVLDKFLAGEMPYVCRLCRWMLIKGVPLSSEEATTSFDYRQRNSKDSEMPPTGQDQCHI
jgi:hypothetical protein